MFLEARRSHFEAAKSASSHLGARCLGPSENLRCLGPSENLHSKNFKDPKPREKLAYMSIERDQTNNTEFLGVKPENDSPVDLVSQRTPGEVATQQGMKIPKGDNVVGRKAVD